MRKINIVLNNPIKLADIENIITHANIFEHDKYFAIYLNGDYLIDVPKEIITKLYINMK